MQQFDWVMNELQRVVKLTTDVSEETKSHRNDFIQIKSALKENQRSLININNALCILLQPYQSKDGFPQ